MPRRAPGPGGVIKALFLGEFALKMRTLGWKVGPAR
ncbi:MAG: hypothetical protein M2R46_03320 [Verrucomicrobia subdivision 3 bacterium]|nr:hypothetical protein [Limisphaerales bacterium]